MASSPLWLALGLIILITAVRMTGTVDSDVAWQLWIARRIHAGAHLYRDIIETNPPLWFWMALPVDRAASLLHIRPEPVLIAAVGGMAALSLAATNELALHVDRKRRAALLSWAALALLVIPWSHVGQREQIAMIATSPYAALVAARLEGRSVQPVLAILIGLGAAVGIALKQYFLLVPFALECWLLAAQRGSWRPLRPETVSMALAGLVYGAAILLFASDFLTRTVPLIRLAYGEFGASNLSLMFGPFAIVGLMIIGFVALQARLLADAPFSAALFVASLAFAAIYFIQFKGWPYHALPMIGLGSLALGALLAEAEAPPPFLRIGAPAILVFPLILSFQEQRSSPLPSKDLISAMQGLKTGDTIAFITTETAVPWSVTLQGGYRYALRYNGFWMMRAIVRNEARDDPDPKLIALGKSIVAETVIDFECTPPKRILVSRPRPNEEGFDILPFFMRDPRFREVLSHYRARSRTSLETYDQVSPLSPFAGPCRAGI